MMALTLVVLIPTSADADEVKAQMQRAVHLGQGVTIETAEHYLVDVDLVEVDEEMEVTG